MAVSSLQPAVGAQLREGVYHDALPRAHLPGQLIVRFKKGAVNEVAANPVAMTARASVAAEAMPDNVFGPIDLLRNEAGMMSVKPLFVTTPKPAAPQGGVMALAIVHSMLAKSATQTPRDALSGFQLVKVQEKTLPSALLKRLNASQAVDFVEPVPNRWLSSVDPLINRQWGLRAIRWFNGKHPDAKEVHVASWTAASTTAIRIWRAPSTNIATTATVRAIFSGMERT
jgi:hypothetical protein